MELISTDMVNYNGIICQYGAIKNHAPNEELILADETEIAWYKYVNSTK